MLTVDCRLVCPDPTAKAAALHATVTWATPSAACSSHLNPLWQCRPVMARAMFHRATTDKPIGRTLDLAGRSGAAQEPLGVSVISATPPTQPRGPAAQPLLPWVSRSTPPSSPAML